MRVIARRLLIHEALENKTFKAPETVRVCEKLRSNLTTLMGNGGFQALLSRALSLALAEASWLGAVRVTPDGYLEGVEELHTQLDEDEFFNGGIVLVAQLLGLLVAFIGEVLTLSLVQEVWPKISFNNLGSGIGGIDEKTK